ncbi:MAG: LacI family DNA-binding transcriptional regulator [Eubacteriales bacterium]
MQKKVTIEEIAQRANVSIATVSRIINNKGSVKEDTRQNILNIMNEMNFSPKTHSILADSKSKCILLCVPDFHNPFIGSVINGIQTCARTNGYTILVMQDNPIIGINYEELLKNISIAGIIVFCSIPNAKSLEDLSLRCPIVVCSERAENHSISHVVIDDKQSAYTAVNYLISTGCEKIALFNCSKNYKYARYREEGYLEAMNDANLKIDPEMMINISSVDYKLAYSNAVLLLSNEKKPDAIFACSDVFAVAIISAANKLGIKIPQELSVIGFDNTYLSTMSEPTLTTIAQPSYQLGFQSCEILLDKILNDNSTLKQITLETELIVRKSTKLNLHQK